MSGLKYSRKQPLGCLPHNVGVLVKKEKKNGPSETIYLHLEHMENEANLTSWKRPVNVNIFHEVAIGLPLCIWEKDVE